MRNQRLPVIVISVFAPVGCGDNASTPHADARSGPDAAAPVPTAARRIPGEGGGGVQ